MMLILLPQGVLGLAPSEISRTTVTTGYTAKFCFTTLPGQSSDYCRGFLMHSAGIFVMWSVQLNPRSVLKDQCSWPRLSLARGLCAACGGRCMRLLVCYWHAVVVRVEGLLHHRAFAIFLVRCVGCVRGGSGGTRMLGS